MKPIVFLKIELVIIIFHVFFLPKLSSSEVSLTMTGVNWRTFSFSSSTVHIYLCSLQFWNSAMSAESFVLFIEKHAHTYGDQMWTMANRIYLFRSRRSSSEATLRDISGKISRSATCDVTVDGLTGYRRDSENRRKGWIRAGYGGWG